MRYFAHLDENDIVTNILVMGSNAKEMIATGRYGDASRMIECEKRGTNEAKIARKGGTYNKGTKVFIDRQPFPSWILDEAKGKWNAPKTMPTDGNMKRWDEPATDWVDVLVDGKTIKL